MIQNMIIPEGSKLYKPMPELNAGVMIVPEMQEQASTGASMNTTSTGPAVYVSSGTSEHINANTIFSNYINSNYGGVICNYYGYMIVDHNVKFLGNSANAGGAIYNYCGNMYIGENVIFAGNNALSGGAIFNKGGAYMHIGENATFMGNSNAVENFGSMSIGQNVTFTTNKETAIYNTGSVFIGDSAVFSENVASNGGGAIDNYIGNITIASSAVFSENVASNGGGAIRNKGSMYIQPDANFFNNQASYGGVIDNNGDMYIGENSIFAGNNATSGGAIYNWGNITIGNNATFTRNSATFGGAIYNSGGRMHIGDNAIFSGNTSLNGCGAICNSGNATLVLQNCKFETNTDTIYNNGKQIIFNGSASVAGNINLTGRIFGGTLLNNGIIDFNVSVRHEEDGVLLNDWTRVSGEGNYAVTVSARQTSGEYKLIGNATDFDKTITVRRDNGLTLGTLSLNQTLKSGSLSLTLTRNEVTNTVSLTVESNPLAIKGDLTGKGTPDIIMVNPAASDAGAWLLDTKGNASWIGLSGLPGTWELFDTGNANGDVYSDVFLYDAANKDIGVWTMNEKGIPGWESWGRLESNCELIAMRDFNGDGLTDLLYRRSNGTIGTYMNGTGGHFEVPLPLDWNMVGVGDINGDGTDDLILRNGNSIGAWLMSANGPRWQGLADVGSINQIVGLGDFNGDGTADILFNTDGSYGAWLMKDGQITGWKAFCDFPTSMAVEAIGDYNGDGIDDLRVRNGNDLAAVMVYTDGLEWKGFGSVPSDWKTSLAGTV